MPAAQSQSVGFYNLLAGQSDLGLDDKWDAVFQEFIPGEQNKQTQLWKPHEFFKELIKIFFFFPIFSTGRVAERGNIPSICIPSTSFPFNPLILFFSALIHTVASFLFGFLLIPPTPNNHKTNTQTLELCVQPPSSMSIHKSLSMTSSQFLFFPSFYPGMTPDLQP